MISWTKASYINLIESARDRRRDELEEADVPLYEQKNKFIQEYLDGKRSYESLPEEIRKDIERDTISSPTTPLLINVPVPPFLKPDPLYGYIPTCKISKKH